MEEEAAHGELNNVELWLFTDNSTAESCFFKSSSTPPLLHESILILRKVEVDVGFKLLISQGTDGLSRGMLLEELVMGKSMLGYIDLPTGAVERYPPLLEFMRDCTEHSKLEVLTSEQWFVEAYGISGGTTDHHGIWIPDQARNRQTHLSPPVVAHVCLEECLKAAHKQRDAFHVFCCRVCSIQFGHACFINFVILSLSCLLAHPTGLLICMNPCGLVFLFRL